MNNFLGNFILELGLFSLLGVLYYFYQKKKIIAYESNKGPIIMGYIFQSCLMERGEQPQPELDSLIESIDDYLHGKTQSPPTALLKVYADSPSCSPELKAVITEGLLELQK